jgi:hypothetical protein
LSIRERILKVGHKLGIDEVAHLLREKIKTEVTVAPRITWPSHQDKQLILEAMVNKEEVVNLVDSAKWNPFFLRYDAKHDTSWVRSHRIDGPCGHFNVERLTDEIESGEYV